MSIQKNTLINLIGSVVPIVVMLVTVPLYLKLLGEVRYGVLALVWLLLGYFSILEMGLGRATTNQIAKACNASATQRAEIFWTALIANAAMGLIGAGILWLVGDFLLIEVLEMPDDFRQEALAALPWMIAALPLALVSSVLNGALEGRSLFLATNLLQAAGNTVFQVAPLAVAYSLGSSLAFVIPAAVASRALMNIPALIVCHYLVLDRSSFAFSFDRVKSLLSYGGWVGATSMAGLLLETLDRLIIGATLGAKAVAHYVIPFQLAAKLRILPSALARALFPRFSGQTDDLAELGAQALQALAAVMTPVIVVVTVLLKPFMETWIGADVARVAVPLGHLFLLGTWVNSLAYVPLIMLQGAGRPDVVAKFHMLELVPFIAVLLAAIQYLGLFGAALAWVLRVTVDGLLLFIASELRMSAVRRLGVPFAMILGSSLVAMIGIAKGGAWVYWVSVLSLVGCSAIWSMRSDVGKALLASGLRYLEARAER